MLKFKKTNIEGLFVISPHIHEDQRGILKKVYERQAFAEQGINFQVYEELETTSKFGVLRGLHFQTEHAQGKLIRVAKGKLQDVAVDVRKGSKTLGQHFSIELSQENRKMLFLPEGLAHGCLALEDNTTFYYLCTQPYCPGYDSGIYWNDKDLNIIWQLNEKDIIVSDKDQNLQSFQEYLSGK